LAKSQSNKI